MHILILKLVNPLYDKKDFVNVAIVKDAGEVNLVYPGGSIYSHESLKVKNFSHL